MTKSKKPNPIENAIGNRAKTKEEIRLNLAEPTNTTPEKLSETNLKQVARNIKKAVITKVSNMENPGFPLTPSEIPDVPSPSEMLSLEELNRQTEERLQDDPKRLVTERITPPKLTEKNLNLAVFRQMKKTPVSKPDPQPVTTTSSPESQPPQKNFEKQIANDGDTPQTQWICPDSSEIITGPSYPMLHECQKDSQKPDHHEKHVATYNKTADALGIPKIPTPAEDRDLTALKTYILDNGFVVSGVAMHIVMLCDAPLVTTSTTDWDFEDRQHIPDMVYGLLRQPGYIDGIWPSLKIVMGISGGNSAWTAGIATSIAFFDVIRTLPTLKALKK